MSRLKYAKLTALYSLYPDLYGLTILAPLNMLNDWHGKLRKFSLIWGRRGQCRERVRTSRFQCDCSFGGVYGGRSMVMMARFRGFIPHLKNYLNHFFFFCFFFSFLVRVGPNYFTNFNAKIWILCSYENGRICWWLFVSLLALSI